MVVPDRKRSPGSPSTADDEIEFLLSESSSVDLDGSSDANRGKYE